MHKKTKIQQDYADKKGNQEIICVDLDGTLTRTDLLLECAIRALKADPFLLLRIPAWVLKGKAYLKKRLAQYGVWDVASLPYNQELVQWLTKKKSEGARIVLATAAWEGLARQVADHLGIFDDVLATSEDLNLSGHAKARKLVDRYGYGCFTYIGDTKKDIPVWRVSGKALTVTDRRGVRQHAVPMSGAILDGFKWRALVRALRPHQWAKNVLVFLPVFAAHAWTDLYALRQVILAFVALSLAASCVYILNDLLDLDADRGHATKSKRPLASGDVGLMTAVVAGGLLLVVALGVAVFVSTGFVEMLVLYLFLTTAYSFYLKRVLFLDVLVLAGLYALRVVGGAVAGGLAVSDWLLAFTVFFFVSLALVKRYAELKQYGDGLKGNIEGRGYRAGDAETVGRLGSAAGYVAVLVLSLYLNSERVLVLYSRPELLWVIVVVLLYWISRLWILAGRGEVNEDPVMFALKDKTTYLAGAVVAFVGMAAI